MNAAGQDVSLGGLNQFLKEVQRRELLGVLALYIVGAWVVLQVSATLFPGWRVPEESIRFVWIGAVLLFPVAVVFGWYYDVSIRGVRRTASGSESQPLSRRDYGVLSLLALITIGICFGAFREVLNSRGASVATDLTDDIPANSIAVMPFVNMSDDQSNEYFSDGMTEQLLDELTRIPGLFVPARTSSFYFKGKAESTKKIGRELGVRTLLEGSVRKSGNRVRITAQLINADDGYRLWSDSFDRELDDIFLVQDEIARAIVNILKVRLMVKEQERLDRIPTDNPEAYDLFLRAVAARQDPSTGAMERSNEYLQKAIDLEPDFALAYAQLAYGYLLLSYQESMSIDDAAERAARLLETALALRPDLEQVHASLGLLKSRLQLYDEANQHYETALAINPNYFKGHSNYGFSLVLQSRLKEASAAYLRAQSLDPLNADLSFNLGALLMLMGQFDDGYQFLQKSVEIEPEIRMPKAAITFWLANYGKLVEAVQYGERTLKDHPDFPVYSFALIYAYTKIGMIEKAKQVLADATEAFPDNTQVRDWQFDIWLAEGDFDSFDELANEQFQSIDANIGDPLSHDKAMRVHRYAVAKLNGSDNESAAELLHWAAGGKQGIAATTYDSMGIVKLLALSYRRLGRNEDADVLLNQCLDLVHGARENGWATPVLHVRLAEIYALLGDLQNAILNLDIAFEKGWRDLSVIDYGIFWQDLRDHPELNRIEALMFMDLESQRTKLRRSSAVESREPVTQDLGRNYL